MRFRARVAPTAFRATPRRVWANLLLGAFCSLGGGEAVHSAEAIRLCARGQAGVDTPTLLVGAVPGATAPAEWQQ